MTDPATNQQDIDNTPLTPNEENDTGLAPQSKWANVDRALWYTIGGIVLVACCGLIVLAFLFTRTSQFKQLTTFPNLSYTPQPTPDMRATERAWRPLPSPVLGSKEEAQRVLADNSVPELGWYATYRPPSPEVNQPGDIYSIAVTLPVSTQDVLWDYGWCSLTQEILDANFEQMKIEFFINGEPASKNRVGVEDYQVVEDRFCRTHSILVTDWPPGTHLLVVDVTFLAPTDDGWNVYPAGTHTFRYYVTVDH